jgi:alpha-tubulin suppressor-like RCC1 family protein
MRLGVLLLVVFGCRTQPFAEPLARAPAEPSPPDLSQPDLAHADLSQPDLTQPDLTQPDLAHADLSQPDLTQPDLAHEPAIQVSAGGAVTCVRRADHTIWCWGANRCGQLGAPVDENDPFTYANPPLAHPFRPSPSPVPALQAARAVAVGACEAAALLDDRTVQRWGWLDGQLSRPSPAPFSDAAEISAGDQEVCVIRTDRTASCARSAVELTQVAQISVGGTLTCALLLDGTPLCWGDNNVYGQLGDGTRAPHAEPAPVLGLHDVKAISAGALHACALLGDGSVECWGDNQGGKLGRGTSGGYHPTPAPVVGLTGAVEIAAGSDHSCARGASGWMRCWGSNSGGKLGDGTLAGAPQPTTVLIDRVVQMAVGHHHTCAVRDDTLWCWGHNAEGALGDGTTVDRLTPVPVILP